LKTQDEENMSILNVHSLQGRRLLLTVTWAGLLPLLLS
jgi:hypothetical protein